MAARHRWFVRSLVVGACGGLLPCQDVASPAPPPAPEFRVTTRAALHDDLTAAALVHEVLSAARHVPGASRTSAGLVEVRVRRAIGQHAQADAAEQALLQRLAQPEQHLAIAEMALLIEPLQRARGVGAALELAGSQLGDGKLQAQLAVLERARAADPARIEHSALVLLAPEVSKSFAPTVLARFANLLRAAGDAPRADEFAALALERAGISADLFAKGDVFSVLMRGRTDRNDFQGARAFAAAYRRASSGGGFAPAEVGYQLLALLQQGIAAGALPQLRDLPAEIEDPGSRAEAHALVAAAEAKAGRDDAADSAWRLAHEAARAAGTPGLSKLTIALHAAGREHEAAACLLLARAGIDAAKDTGQRAAFECRVGSALAALGQFDEAIAVVDRIPGKPDYLINSRDEYLRELAMAAWAKGPASKVLPLLDRCSTAVVRARAIRDLARKFGQVERPERERAQLAVGLVERLRVGPPDVLLAGLLAILEGGLVPPRNPSALHPWSLPPTVPDGWRTPGDGDAAAHQKALARCLDEGHLPAAQVRAMRERPLQCYPDGRLVELDGVVEGLPYVFTLLAAGGRTILIGGTGRAWNALNDALPPDLGSDAALLEYARIFATQIGDAGGRSRMVASSDELAELVRAGGQLPVLAIEPPRVLERTPESMRVQATFAFAGVLQTARLHITRQGRVTMHDERMLVGDLPLDRESFQEQKGGFLRISAGLAAALKQLEAEPAAGAFAIGQVYATGFGRGGFLLDPLRAAEWVRRAEAKGRAHAFRDVGLQLQRGDSGPADAHAAAFWLRQAADRGDADAALALARSLLATQSPALVADGLALLDRAAAAGHAEATNDRAVHTHNGTLVSAAAPTEGRAQFALAAERGSGAGALQLGLIHADAISVPRDPKAAARWFQRAADLGVANGHYFLGVMRATGAIGDGPSAEEHYQRAVAGGVVAARVVLALRSRRAGAAGRPAGAVALEHARAAAAAGHCFGALAQALLELDAGDVAAARAAHQRALTLPLPAPLLRSFVDPCYLDAPPQGAPAQAAAVDAGKCLQAWRTRVEGELAARLPAR